jgi:hypothetical protein
MPPFANGASDDDVRLVERLRAKYSQRADVLQHDQGSGQGAPAPAGPGSEAGGAGEQSAAHVRVCGVCHGEGRTQTVYNHRVLQVRLRMRSGCMHGPALSEAACSVPTNASRALAAVHAAVHARLVHSGNPCVLRPTARAPFLLAAEQLQALRGPGRAAGDGAGRRERQRLPGRG